MVASDRLLLVGFRPSEVQSFLDQGANVQSAFVNLDRGVPAPDLPVELFLHYDVVRCVPQAGLRPDFPAETRKALYDAAFQMFRRHYARVTFARSRSFRSWVDLDNLFSIAANFFFDLIRRKDVTAVVFGNFPHEGSYIILYHLARLLGIKTVIATQSQFPARLWLVRDIYDFGTFHSVNGGGHALPAPEAPTHPFYMKRRGKFRRTLGTSATLLREAAKLAAKTVTLKFLFDPTSIDRNMSRFVQARDRLKLGAPSPRDIAEVDLSRPYVYFPLHLQPEMTTDTWGFIYADQLLAIEELAAALPPDVLIYAKENPIQTKFMREESFYRRLRAIPNLRYVGEHVPTFDLIRNALFVATISGTAGYEAALMGKGAIHFGVAWYATLPGVFRWQGPETVQKALAAKPDRAALEAAFAALTRKLYPGVVDPYYGVLIPGFDREAEGRRAVQSILAALSDTPLTPEPRQ